MKARTQEQIERRRAVRRKCYLKHRESILAYAAKYRAEHADDIAAWRAEHNAECVRRYRERNYQKCLEMTHTWKEANRERHRAYCAEWTRNNPLKNCLKEHRRRARKAAAGGTLSEDIVDRLLILQKGRCACCGEKLSDQYHIDHIVPLARGGSNSDENVQLLLPRCNWSKGAKDPITYMQTRGRLL